MGDRKAGFQGVYHVQERRDAEAHCSSFVDLGATAKTDGLSLSHIHTHGAKTDGALPKPSTLSTITMPISTSTMTPYQIYFETLNPEP